MPPATARTRRIDGIPPVVPQRYEDAVPLDQLKPHPLNPNAGDVGLISTLIDANGYVTPVLAQDSTGLMIDGEHRWKSAQAMGMAAIPVVWLDVDDDTTLRLLASLNESTRRGMNDEAKLITLLSGLTQTPRGLAGAAFDGEDLDELIARSQPDGGPDRGDLLAVAGVTTGEPRHHVKDGQVWRVGPHRLAVADVYTGWPVWARLLTPEAVFLPYPTPLLPHAENLPGPLVLVQPEPFLAAVLLDKWEDVTGDPPLLEETGQGG